MISMLPVLSVMCRRSAVTQLSLHVGCKNAWVVPFVVSQAAEESVAHPFCVCVCVPVVDDISSKTHCV